MVYEDSDCLFINPIKYLGISDSIYNIGVDVRMTNEKFEKLGKKIYDYWMKNYRYDEMILFIEDDLVEIKKEMYKIK